jgi:hypothetical protein
MIKHTVFLAVLFSSAAQAQFFAWGEAPALIKILEKNPISPLKNPISPLKNPISPLKNPISPLSVDMPKNLQGNLTLLQQRVWDMRDENFVNDILIKTNKLRLLYSALLTKDDFILYKRAINMKLAAYSLLWPRLNRAHKAQLKNALTKLSDRSDYDAFLDLVRELVDFDDVVFGFYKRLMSFMDGLLDKNAIDQSTKRVYDDLKKRCADIENVPDLYKKNHMECHLDVQTLFNEAMVKDNKPLWNILDYGRSAEHPWNKAGYWKNFFADTAKAQTIMNQLDNIFSAVTHPAERR